MIQRVVLLVAAMLGVALAQAEFSISDTGRAIEIREDGRAVVTHHYGWVMPPEGVKHRFYRTGYIHPLYGLDGEVLTQDFPDDHYHHRGVFWGWPDTQWQGRRVDTWGLDGARQATVSCAPGEATSARASFSGENVWVFDEGEDYPIASERYAVVVHAATDTGRALDVTLTWTNLTDAPIYVRGAVTDDKGYGGFNFRPDKTRAPMHFTSALGAHAEDVFDVASPWVDVSYATAPGAETLSGVAIFQHPENPGYPYDWWLLRHYGFLGHSWPGNAPYALKPGEAVTVRYRLYIHRGDAAAGKVAEAFAAYVKDVARADRSVGTE
ncbi:MAG: PmoA family protein [Candidatus Hydrogenedentes bacterium]|nr:PmoA family protein [Candidatus Hydrogenedentota bacterium]